MCLGSITNYYVYFGYLKLLGNLVIISFSSVIAPKTIYSSFSNESHLFFHSIEQSIQLPPALAYYSVDACLFGSQASVDEAFFIWVDNIQKKIEDMYEENEDATVTNNSLLVSIPEICIGGTVIVRWEVKADTDTTEVDAVFELIPPDPIGFDFPENIEINSCDIYFSSYTYEVAQTALDTIIEHWLSENTHLIENTLSGGCDVIVYNNYSKHYIDLCIGDSMAIEWTIADRCDTITLTASFILNPPPPITYAMPDDLVVDACDFYNGDLEQAQLALNANFDWWLMDIFNQFYFQEGCDPQIIVDWNDSYPNICGDQVTITWVVVDLCDIYTAQSVYTVNPLSSLSWIPPEDVRVHACDFANQRELDAAFAYWLCNFNNVQTSCNDDIDSYLAQFSVPELATGGIIQIILDFRNECGGSIHESTFEVISPGDEGCPADYLYVDLSINQQHADDCIGNTQVSESIIEGKVQIFPNPGKGVFNLIIDNTRAGESFTLKVVNQLGKEVYLKELTASSDYFQSNLDLSHLNPGSYIFSIQTKRTRIVKQLVII